MNELKILNELTNAKLSMNREISELLVEVRYGKFPDFSYELMKAKIEQKWMGKIGVLEKRWEIIKDEHNYNLDIAK